MSSILKKILFSIVIFAFIPISSISQTIRDTIQIREVKITGKRIYKKEEAGMKTTQVDTLILMEKVNVSLSDILSENTNIFIKDHGRGALATASFRGTAPSHTQVTWNGININSPMLGMVDFSLIPAFLIDDLNLKHGSASITESSGGLGGSISIQNMPQWDNKLSWRYMQGIGSFTTHDEFGQINAGNLKFQSKTRVFNSYSKNDYEYINKAITERPKVKNENADYLKRGILQEFYLRPDLKNVLSLKLWGQHSERSLPSVMSYEGDDQSNLNDQIDQTVKAALEWTNYGSNFKVNLRSGVDYQNLGYTLMNRVGGVGLIPAINSSSSILSWYNHALGEYSFSEEIKVQGSFDYNRYDVKTYESVKETGYDTIRNDLSMFCGVFYSPSEKIDMSLILREDLTGEKLSPLIFNFGINYAPLSKEDLVLKGNISRNYHHPTLNDLYWQPGGNPDLLSESGYTGEIGISYDLDYAGLEINQELTSYYSKIDNWIIWLPGFQGYWEPFNVKMVKSYGVEYQLKVVKQLGEFEVQLHGNYSMTKSLNYGEKLFLGDGSYGKQLPFIPVHSANILLSVSFRGFYLRFQNNSYSERFTMNSNQIGLEDDSEDIGAGTGTSRMNWYYPYYMNNLTIGKDLRLGKYSLSLDFRINNLFDEEYRSVLGRYMPGRNYNLMLKFAFDK